MTDINNPFRIPTSAVISFSGGRTSGMMLYRILEAYNFSLPDDIKVVFCNTGKEREETLEFVERCSQEWNVPITWLEYVTEDSIRGGKPVKKKSFKVVDIESASRNGEPFEHLINPRTMLPNAVMRFCTSELKVLTLARYVKTVLQWNDWFNVVGFRLDEENRVYSAKGLNKRNPHAELTLFDHTAESPGDWKKPVKGERLLFPLYEARINRDHVMQFWNEQSFDLQLQPHEGNCDGCFLKGKRTLIRTFEDNPNLADWWTEQEDKLGATFRNDVHSYRELKMIATGQQLPGEFDFGPVDHSVDGRGCALWDGCRCTD